MSIRRSRSSRKMKIVKCVICLSDYPSPYFR